MFILDHTFFFRGVEFLIHACKQSSPVFWLFWNLFRKYYGVLLCARDIKFTTRQAMEITMSRIKNFALYNSIISVSYNLCAWVISRIVVNYRPGSWRKPNHYALREVRPVLDVVVNNVF